MKVEMIKNPSGSDWLFTKQCTLNTIGKTTLINPNDDWKVKLLESEHSPIRTLQFAFKLEIPYYVSVQLVRSKIGVEHYILSQRNDRQDKYDRTTASQSQLVSHIIYLNADAFVTLSHKRLCLQADKIIREVVQKMVELSLVTNPEFKTVLIKNCDYRGGKCTEFFKCNLYK